MGIVHHFFNQEEFIGSGDFIWKKVTIKEKNVIYVGCKFSIWGNIAGEVARILAKRGAKLVIYIGKLGGLKKEFIPNYFLSTGNTSQVDGREVKWNNIFDDIKNDAVIHGKHITLPSVIQETKEWRDENQESFDFVYPEIGCIAKACLEEKIQFSYLHIISDNLSYKYKEDLSNERKANVILKRRNLYLRIKNILKAYELME